MGKPIVIRGPLSRIDRFRVIAAVTWMTWRWMWNHTKDNVTLKLSVDKTDED